jgi:hypothetical protein
MWLQPQALLISVLGAEVQVCNRFRTPAAVPLGKRRRVGSRNGL